MRFSRGNPGLRRWVVVVLNGVLFLAIVYDLLQLAGLLPNLSAPPVTPLPGITVGETGGQVPVKQTIPRDWHPFGQTTADGSTPGITIPTTAPDTSLNFTLLGVLYFDRPDHTAGLNTTTRALINGPDMPEKGFRVQDVLPGNAQIVTIYPDRVILKRNGQFETLRLPGKQREWQTHKPADTLAPRSTPLRQLRELALTRPEEALAQVRIEPLYQAEKFVGYQLFPGNNSGLLEQFALRPGDVVTAINGMALDSPAHGLQAIGSLANMRELHLRILRDGDSKNFDYFMDHRPNP